MPYSIEFCEKSTKFFELTFFRGGGLKMSKIVRTFASDFGRVHQMSNFKNQLKMDSFKEKLAECEALFSGLPMEITQGNEALECLCSSKDDWEAARCYIMDYAKAENVVALKSWCLHYISILKYIADNTNIACVIAEKLDSRLSGFIEEGQKKLNQLKNK